MALKDIFTMVKADRYTADGCEELNKAREADVEDRRYNVGEISEKTGLQKTANGWVKPKKGGNAGAEKAGRNSERINKSWKQSDVISSLPNGWKRVEGATTAPNGYVVVSNNKSRFGGERETKLMKEEPKNVHGAEVDKIYERQLKRIKELKAKGFTDEQIDNDKIIKQTKEDMKNVGKKPESKPAEETKTETTTKFETEQENAKYEEGKKGWETVSKERLPDIKKKVEQKIDYYKKYDPYAMLGKRTGLNAAQKKAVEQNMVQAKENLAFFTGQLEGINEQMGTGDSAPRVLTGDTRIRVRKA